MKKEMLINVLQQEECRIAIVEDGVLEELYVERSSLDNVAGNIYKGKVVNLEPTIQAAFVDFGIGRNGFLHVSDVEYQYYKHLLSEGEREEKDSKTGRVFNERTARGKPPIQDIFTRGSEVLVQVIKEGIGNKGPTLSTYISIPGRYLVLMPGLQRLGVSRKIPDDNLRRKLRQSLRDMDPPAGLGFIIRTAGIDRSRKDLQRDLHYLLRLWKTIVRRVKNNAAPDGVYEESDMVTRTIRDIYANDIETIWIDEKTAYDRIVEFMTVVLPKHVDRIKFYDGKEPLFHKYHVEREIDIIQQRKVNLEGGGSIVIDQTEALVAIDVNSGSFRSEGDAEQNAFKVNMNAAEEIARQIRLRDLGGVIVNDFIDMRDERHRRAVEKKLHECVMRDRARTKVLRISPFGLIEMTRQRIRPSLKRSVYEDCPCCSGHGYVKTSESMAIVVMRRLMTVAANERVHRVDVEVSQRVADYLINRKRRDVTNLEEQYDVLVNILTAPYASPEHLKITGRDDLGVEIPVLEVAPAPQRRGPSTRTSGSPNRSRSSSDRTSSGNRGSSDRNSGSERGSSDRGSSNREEGERSSRDESRGGGSRSSSRGNSRRSEDETDRNESPRSEGRGSSNRGESRSSSADSDKRTESSRREGRGEERSEGRNRSASSDERSESSSGERSGRSRRGGRGRSNSERSNSGPSNRSESESPRNAPSRQAPDRDEINIDFESDE